VAINIKFLSELEVGQKSVQIRIFVKFFHYLGAYCFKVTFKVINFIAAVDTRYSGQYCAST